MRQGEQAPGLAAPAPDRQPAVRLYALLAVNNAAMFAAYAGVNAILVPGRIAAIDPRHKVTDVALVAGVSAICAVLANPVGGALSDRTGSRFGRRRPWLLIGSLGALAGMAVLADARTLAILLIAQCVTQAMMNVYQAALTAIVPDRVPVRRRGTVSAVIGVAVTVGTAGGTAAAAELTGSRTAFYVLALALVGAAVLLAVLTGDPPVARRATAEDQPAGGSRQRLTRRVGDALSVLRGDLAWVFAGRAAMILSYNLVFVYLLYIVADYVRKPAGITAAQGVAILTVVSVATSILAIVAAGILADRLNRYRVFVFAASLLGGAALILPAISPAWSVILACAAVEGLAIGVYLAVDTALVTLVLPSAQTAARDLGVVNIANAAPPVVAPFIASLIVLAVGYRAVFACGCAIALLASVTVWRVRGVP
jgi:MFS family permease